ncbi:hypothetical protein [Streptomyces werraensis]|uniref:hypothetical protein n=1 Tax=Streptomyces werraensis TaxID=68284 RepID=UPI001CE2A919
MARTGQATAVSLREGPGTDRQHGEVRDAKGLGASDGRPGDGRPGARTVTCSAHHARGRQDGAGVTALAFVVAAS